MTRLTQSVCKSLCDTKSILRILLFSHFAIIAEVTIPVLRSEVATVLTVATAEVTVPVIRSEVATVLTVTTSQKQAAFGLIPPTT